MPKDLNLPFPPESDHHHQMDSSGLMRFRSAPTTLLGDVSEELLPHRSPPPESLSMFERFIGLEKQQTTTTHRLTGDGEPSAPHMFFQQQLFPSLARQNSLSDLHIPGEYCRGRLKPPGPEGFMAEISDNGEEVVDGNAMPRCSIPGYPLTSWENSLLLSGSFAPKRGREPPEPEVIVSPNGGARTYHQLTQHLSLPAAEIGVERFLQFQDAAPCLVRAKRGCATHPRSIAERVRRTKISERMRKLQELVPNMDKQTSTADMLELAVEYIKDLQRSVQTLTESKAKCSCTSKKKKNP